MTLAPENRDKFVEIFNENKSVIRNFPGCNHLELMQDIDNQNVFITYSYWDTADDLENYRNSNLFKGIWRLTKPLFSKKTIAHSVKKVTLL